MSFSFTIWFSLNNMKITTNQKKSFPNDFVVNCKCQNMIQIYDLFKLKLFSLKKTKMSRKRKGERKKLIADVVVLSIQIHAAQINKKGDRRDLKTKHLRPNVECEQNKGALRKKKMHQPKRKRDRKATKKKKITGRNKNAGDSLLKWVAHWTFFHLNWFQVLSLYSPNKIAVVHLYCVYQSNAYISFVIAFAACQWLLYGLHASNITYSFSISNETRFHIFRSKKYNRIETLALQLENIRRL